jgi:hypothetical protein
MEALPATTCWRREQCPRLGGPDASAQKMACRPFVYRLRSLGGIETMKSREDIESYLIRIGLPYDQLGPEMWNIRPQGNENLLVTIAGPVVVFRVKVMDLPGGNREPLYAALLRLNATEMVHGAFGVEGEAVVITYALQLENLDFNEFQGAVEDITLAIGKHYPALSKFRAAA